MLLVFLHFTYGTNNPQQKWSTRVTRVLSLCHTRVAFMVWMAVWLHTRVHTQRFTHVCAYTYMECLHVAIVSHSMYILQSRHI